MVPVVAQVMVPVSDCVSCCPQQFEELLMLLAAFWDDAYCPIVATYVKAFHLPVLASCYDMASPINAALPDWAEGVGCRLAWGP